MSLQKGKKTFQVVVLAAGQGTRMRLDMPKPLVPILGQPMISYILEGISRFSSQVSDMVQTAIVVGHQGEKVESFLDTREEKYQLAWQREQLGTGHAVQCFFRDIPDAWDTDYLIIACGDTPLLEGEDFLKMYQKVKKDDLEALCAVFKTETPYGFGRIIPQKRGFSIVEEKEASEEERKVKEVNSGFYFFKTEFLKKYLKKINSENKTGEFYLTDLFAFSDNAKTLVFPEKENFLGVNDLIQLEEAETILLRRKIKSLQLKGVRFIKPESTYVDWAVSIGEGSVIHPQVFLQGNVKIGKNCYLESGVVVKDSHIEDRTNIFSYSYLEEAQVGEDCHIGPMARVRPGSHFEKNVKVGNFVETKKTLLKEGAKVSHLSYVGDAEIGEETNLGCGFITCNYDGAKKHKTIIGRKTFVGSDCQMIAPIEIGDRCFIAAGSTITKNVEDGGFAIARSRQETKEGKASRFLP